MKSYIYLVSLSALFLGAGSVQTAQAYGHKKECTEPAADGPAEAINDAAEQEHNAYKLRIRRRIDEALLYSWGLVCYSLIPKDPKRGEAVREAERDGWYKLYLFYGLNDMEKRWIKNREIALGIAHYYDCSVEKILEERNIEKRTENLERANRDIEILERRIDREEMDGLDVSGSYAVDLTFSRRLNNTIEKVFNVIRIRN